MIKGKKGLIIGIANDHSIAWGIAKQLHANGAELAITYQNSTLLKRVKPLADKVNSNIVIECNVNKINNDIALLNSEVGNFKIKINKDIRIDDKIIFGIRPEEIKIIDKKNDSSLELKIKEVDFKGSTSTINLLSNNSNKIIKIQNISSNISKNFSEGDSIYIEFNSNSGNIFFK